MGTYEPFSQFGIPLGDQHRGVTDGIEAMPPAGCLVDGERTLVITAM
jgi:hypothetical protein